MNKLEQIKVLVEEALKDFQQLPALDYHKNLKQILTDLAKRSAEIDYGDWSACALKNWNTVEIMKEYNTRLLGDVKEEVKQEQPALQLLPKQMPEWFITYFNDRGNDAATCWSHIVLRFGTQSNNLQPLPENRPEWFMTALTNPLTDRQKLWNKIIQYFGTQPREWWRDLKKGDKFMYGKEIRVFLGYIAIVDEHHRSFNVNDCSPYISPEEELIKTFSPEQKKLWEMMKEGKA